MTTPDFFEENYSPALEDKFVRLVEQKSGIVFDNIKRRELKKTISVCMREIDEHSFLLYYNRLISGTEHGEPAGKELKKLINFITINETFFFRVPEHFEILEKTALPAVVEKKKTEEKKKITVWSAGASSGEEVYSIIISLLEFPGLKENDQWQVLGTDINEDMLYIAEKGIYSGRTLNKVPAHILQDYFDPFRDRYKIRDVVKTRARFRYLNLAEPFEHKLETFNHPDIIFFRNVLIYFSLENTRRIIETFYHLLPDGGFLFLGPSETLWDISDKFELMMFERAYIYRKKAPSELKKTVEAKPFRPPSKPPRIPVSPVLPVSPILVEDTPPPVDIFPSVKDRIRIMRDEAALMIELGDYQKAEEVVDEMMLVEAAGKPAFLLKIILYTNQANEEKLREWVDRALGTHPVFPEIHFILGRFYESRGNVNDALTEYKKILFIHQDYLLARERMLRMLYSRGEALNAKREARTILEQLSSGLYKEFEHPVGETVNKERLKKFCRLVLS